MPNISDSIETIGSILDALNIDADKLAPFREQYQKILCRSKDPNFYLSAIGDFSSGKSTLINTMIKQKLLKVAHTATTAVPTYIYRGQQDSLQVRIVCQDGAEYELTSQEGAAQLEETFGIRLPPQTDGQLALLTADPELSLKIKEVHVQLPEEDFANDLCIIDTPGINPGADYAQNHEAITASILNEKADGIIILFPADQAYTQVFEKFLKDHAQLFMQDAIFVVTMLDRVDEEEREDVVRFVQTNLKNNFHLPDPQVLSCAAMQAERDPYWAEQFAEFEQQLMQRLAHNRQRIITEKLIKLSHELLSSIQSEISDQQEHYEARLAVLQEHSVPNLNTVLSECNRVAFAQLDQIRQEHHSAIQSQDRFQLENKIMSAVLSGLNACNTRSAVTQYVNTSLAGDIEGACQEMYGISTQHTGLLNTVLSQSLREMIEKMAVYYGQIGNALPETATISDEQPQITIADKLTGLGSQIGNFEGTLDVATALGGAGLAAIILTGLGPVGWIIGGFAALIGGDRLLVGTARSKVKEAVLQRIPSIHHSLTQGLCDGMETNYLKAKTVIAEKKKELVAQYTPVYETIENQFRLEKQELTDKIEQSKHIQSQIQTVLRQLGEIQGGIAG